MFRMRQKIREALYFLFCLICVTTCGYGVNKAWAAFKDTGWGARAPGMGGAFCAVADDAGSPLWNPAGITQVRRPEANFMYARLFTGLEGVRLGLGYFSFIIPRNKYTGAWGISWANSFSASLYREDTLVFSYAERLNDFLLRLIPEASLGASVKYLRHSYTLDRYAQADISVFSEGSSAGSFTVDAGILVKSPPQKEPVISLGASVKNITEPDVGLRTRDIVPRETRLGIACLMGDFKVFRRIVLEDVLVGFDVVFRSKDWNYHAGWEAWFNKRTFGLRTGANDRELTLGLSYISEFARDIGLQIDYAFVFPLGIQESWGSHRISLCVRFGRP